MGKIPGPGTRCTVEAPCKINLHLRVKDRRPDGFHELESIFLALSFGDLLEFEVLPVQDEGDCRILMNMAAPGDPFPPEQNLVYRAVSLFRERTGFRPGLKIRLEKNVPPGSGLGGGSSDAAAALRALDLLAGTGLSRKALGEMAEKLGSDVPFFLDGGAALVTGRGERIRRLENPRGISAALVYPGFPSGTAAAFRLLDQIREGGREKVGIPGPDFRGLRAGLRGSPAAWPFGNDFLPVFLAAGGEAAAAYRETLDTLRGLGAEFSGLSGAGSACFGIFSGEGRAEKAVNALSGRRDFVRLAFPLAHPGRAVLQ